jgi:ABC-2 type transport system ATP-binding protein
MSEMELMCDRVGIIANGVLIDVKTVAELIESVRSPMSIYRIKTDNVQQAFTLVDNVPDEKKSVTDDGLLELRLERETADDTIKNVILKIIQGGCMLYSVMPVEEKSLEDAFIELTQTGGGVQID